MTLLNCMDCPQIIFDGIAIVHRVLESLGILVDVYIASEIDQDALEVIKDWFVLEISLTTKTESFPGTTTTLSSAAMNF